MANPTNPVPETPIASAWAADVVSRVVLTFPTVNDADAWYGANPPDVGQRRHIVNPGVEQVYDGGAWVDVRRVFGSYGWRDARAAWGRLAGVLAEGVPDGADVMTVTAHLVWTPVAGYGMGPVTVETVGDRLLSLEGVCRFDGGAFASDGTAMVRVMRVSPSPGVVGGEGIVAVFAVSPSGGGASTVVPFQAYDAPPPGTATYRLEVAKRIPADSTSPLRVRAPVGLAVVDLGPRVQEGAAAAGGFVL